MNILKKGGRITTTFGGRQRGKDVVTKLLLEVWKMSEGHIPVNAIDLPINVPALDESGVYTVTLKRVTLNPTRSKPKDGSTGLIFCKIQTEVAEGDFEGAFLPMNYLPLPFHITSDMKKGEIYKATKANVPFGRFCVGFHITGPIPLEDEVNLLDSESINAWQDWISRFYESRAQVTIKNQEYPEGTGKLSSYVNDFIF